MEIDETMFYHLKFMIYSLRDSNERRKKEIKHLQNIMDSQTAMLKKATEDLNSATQTINRWYQERQEHV